jgi:beta-lactamase superfamily II metal-dependent hydrolase
MPHDPGFDDYVSADTASIRDATSGGKEIGHVLWGDGVRTVQDDGGPRVKVKVRGRTGWIDRTALGGTSLLEYYFIDVGQGDGILIKTPDWRHIMIDGGYPRASQPTGKSAADFVDWKFAKDYAHDTIVLDAMVSSHIDFDHYGGLSDILDVAQLDQLDCAKITVEAFYHSGLSHWAAHGGAAKGLGPWVSQGGRKWFTRLLDDRASAVAGTDGGTAPQLRGAWAGLIRHLLTSKNAAGGATALARVDQGTGWLPGFDQGSSVPIRVLGPLAGAAAGGPALMRLASDQSQNTNGTSVLLRIDHGRTRTLMTGDLNANSHQALLAEYDGREIEFAVDVAKCCHHGSEDVSYSFLHRVNAACTVISSGDAEGHDHPRPRIVAASGLSGHVEIRDDRLVTPLVYSTELARSVTVGALDAVEASAAAGGARYDKAKLGALTASYKVTAPGGLRPSNHKATLRNGKVMHKLLYGLVNIRTDGNRILSATMNEGDGSFSVKSFLSRFP